MELVEQLQASGCFPPRAVSLAWVVSARVSLHECTSLTSRGNDHGSLHAQARPTKLDEGLRERAARRGYFLFQAVRSRPLDSVPLQGRSRRAEEAPHVDVQHRR